MDKDSAILRLSNEIAVGVAQSNHKMMCKFDDSNSQRYKPVWLAIQAVAEAALAAGADSVPETTQTNREPAHVDRTRIADI